jgi:hypothetical protein
MAVFSTTALHLSISCIRNVAFGLSFAVSAYVSAVAMGPAVCGRAATISAVVASLAAAASISSSMSTSASTSASTALTSRLVLVDLGLEVGYGRCKSLHLCGHGLAVLGGVGHVVDGLLHLLFGGFFGCVALLG